MDILKEVVFTILMQNGQGIIGKAPSYLQEKREMIDKFTSGDQAARYLLDSLNQALYDNYKKTWLRS